MNGNIRNDAQFKAATDYLLAKSASADKALDEEDFKRSCGAGVVVSSEEIEDQVGAFFAVTLKSSFRWN